MRARREARRLLLDVALVPEREREQAPELAAAVLARRPRARRAAAPPARDGRSPGAAASRPRASRARTARARRAARRPRGSRSRACGRARSRAAAAARPPCAAAPSSRVRAPCAGSGGRTRSSSRPSRGTARGPRASAPSRRGRSSRAGRRRGRRRSRRPAGGRAPSAPSVSAVAVAVDVDRIERSSRRPVSSARSSGEKISFQPWCRSSGGRCAARTKRFAL